MTGEKFKVGLRLGRHIVIELMDCPPELLDSIEFLKKTLREAAIASNSTVISDYFYKFKPQGVSGFVLIAESHISIHTWPEYGYAAVDIYTCGNDTDPWKGLEVLTKRLKPKRLLISEIERGVDMQKIKVCEPATVTA